MPNDLHALVAIPELDRLVDTGGSSRWYGRTEPSFVGVHIGLDCGVSARVNDLAANHLHNRRRGHLLQLFRLHRRAIQSHTTAKGPCITSLLVSSRQIR